MIPTKIPTAGILDLYISIDSGNSSAKTTYSIAPEAKLNYKAKAVGPITPI